MLLNKFFGTVGLALTMGAGPVAAQTNGQAVAATHAEDWKYIKESDVLWHKRVWRNLDLSDKQNSIYANTTPGGNLFLDVLLHGIKEDKLGAYKADNDNFITKL